MGRPAKPASLSKTLTHPGATCPKASADRRKARLCCVSWYFQLPLTSPNPYQHNLIRLPEIDNPKWRVNQFANMVQVKFRNNPASIRMALEHFAMLQNSNDEFITDARHTLLFVILLNSL